MAKKILVIEDEETLRRAMVEFLTEEKFSVVSAENGEKGLAMAVSENPDLILLDIILPKLDGYEVLSGIKKDAKTKNIPVILLTNLESAEDIQKAFERGATTYLIKSDYKLEDIAKKIREILKIEK